MATLGPEHGHVFRITHVGNIPWILDHGLHCRSSVDLDPNFVSIGMPDLIEKRKSWPVMIGPGGSLSDYVPFYFTPWSIMLYKIVTGHDGVRRQSRHDIAILVSTLRKLEESGTRTIFTNGHALMKESGYFDNPAELGRIDWDILNRRDFEKDPEDPGKLSRYQAEALAHRLVPVDALSGIACYDDNGRQRIEAQLRARGLSISVLALPDWFFP